MESDQRAVADREAGSTAHPNLTLTAYATLGLLSSTNQYSATETQDRARTYLRHFYWTPALSHIRRELDRLETLGLVDCREEKRGRIKRTLKYWLTPAGLTEVQRWSQDRDNYDPPVRKNPAILKLWLGRRSTNPREVLAAFERQLDHINSEREELRAHMRDIEANIAQEDADTDPGSDQKARNTAWHLEVMRYCVRDYDSEMRNLEQLREGLEPLL